MTELLKHERFRYCALSDCRWFSACGLAISDKMLAEAKKKGLDVKFRKPCANYNHSFDKREKKEKQKAQAEKQEGKGNG